MAFTQSDIDTLKAAIATGATLVRFGSGVDSREVRYRTLQDMRDILAQMEAEVNPASVGPTRTVGAYRSGLSEPNFPDYGGWNRRFY